MKQSQLDRATEEKASLLSQLTNVIEDRRMKSSIYSLGSTYVSTTIRPSPPSSITLMDDDGNVARLYLSPEGTLMFEGKDISKMAAIFVKEVNRLMQ